MLRYDPASLRATHPSSLGLSRETAQFRTSNIADPSRGGTRGYPLHLRYVALDTFHNTLSVEEAADSINCSTRSIYRWVQRPFAYKMTGGRPRAHLTGADQLLLSVCLFIYPDASIDEISAFIYANGGGIYERPTVSTRCAELGLSRKRSSKESYAAFSPSSLQKYRWFLTLPPPLGVSGISIDKFIDIDETSFYLKTSPPNMADLVRHGEHATPPITHVCINELI